jgi:hypothetical protein
MRFEANQGQADEGVIRFAIEAEKSKNEKRQPR